MAAFSALPVAIQQFGEPGPALALWLAICGLYFGLSDFHKVTL